MKRVALAVLVFWPALASAQDVPLKVEVETTEVKIIKIVKPLDPAKEVVTSFPITIHAPAGAGLYFWSYPPGVQAIDKNDALQITAAPKGKLTVGVKAIAAKLDKDGKFIGFDTRLGQVSMDVGEVTPPKPPDPGPKPPDPPTPTPAPINADGLHVMIIFETEDKAKLPPGQFDIIYGLEMRTWLKANCAADPQTGDQKAYWIVDKDESLSQLDKKWQDAAKRPRQEIPWLIISNRGKGGYEGPLPADAGAAIKLMEKYK